MIQVNYVAIVVATFAAFIFSALYYLILNKKIKAIRESYVGNGTGIREAMTPNKIVIELTRTFVLGLAMAYAVVNVQSLKDAAIVAIWLWIALPVVLFIGLVMYDHFPGRLAVIHAFDWLVKLLIIVTVLTLWR